MTKLESTKYTHTSLRAFTYLIPTIRPAHFKLWCGMYASIIYIIIYSGSRHEVAVAFEHLRSYIICKTSETRRQRRKSAFEGRHLGENVYKMWHAELVRVMFYAMGGWFRYVCCSGSSSSILMLPPP